MLSHLLANTLRLFRRLRFSSGLLLHRCPALPAHVLLALTRQLALESTRLCGQHMAHDLACAVEERLRDGGKGVEMAAAAAPASLAKTQSQGMPESTYSFYILVGTSIATPNFESTGTVICVQV